MDQYKLVHKSDSSIEYTYRRATPAEFATYWNANAASNGKPNIFIQSNLAIALRESPDEQTFKELLDAEWSNLPAEAIGLLLRAAGLFVMADKANNEYGEHLDMSVLGVAEKRTVIKDGVETLMDPHNAAHMARMRQLGMTDAMFGQWLGKRNPALTRVVIALPESIGGYYVGRVPSLNDRHNAQQIQNAPASDEEHGAFDALCRFFLDCSLWCAPLTPAQMIEQWPGAVMSIAMKVRDIGTDSFVIEQKK